jgi:putative FmdB family regulatory protein
MQYDYRCICGEIFITSHGMNEKPKVVCPKCGSIKTAKTFIQAPFWYTKGYGWVKDKAGVARARNLHTLVNNDPYKSMREKGEKEDLANRLRKGGRHNPKKKHFIAG